MPPKIKKRATWTVEQSQATINAVKYNELSQREAAQRYKIPRRTIRNNLKSGVLTKKIGRSSILTPDQEIKFSARIIRSDDSAEDIPLSMAKNILSDKIKKSSETPVKLGGVTQTQTE